MKIRKIFFSMISIISINSFSVVKNQSDSDRVLDNFNELQKKQNIENELKKLDNNTRIENNKTESAIENNENLESYVFNTISLIGEKKISSFQKNIMEKYKNRNVTKKDILNLVKEMSNYYLKKGYITTIVTINTLDIKNKNLVLEVKKGYVATNSNVVFSNKKGKVLNIFDVDQVIENMNTGLTSATVDIVASDKEGYSTLLVNKKREKQIGGYVFLNNGQYKDYGREQLGIQLSRDNLLGLSDVLNLGFYKRLTKKSKDNREDVYFLSYNIPFGYYNFRYDMSASKSKNLVEGLNGNYVSKNEVLKQNFTLSKTFFRNQTTKWSGDLGIKLNKTKNSFEDLVVDVSSQKYTNLLAQINYFHKIKNGAMYASFGYERGLKWFGGAGDDKDSVKKPYKKEFDKYNFDFLLNKNFMLTKNQAANYKLNIGASYSDDRLLSRNKFDIGSEYTVRGFKESSVSGDKGIYINNTLTLLNKSFSPFIGLDFGISKDKDLDFVDKIAGIAAGVKYNKNNLNMSLTFSRPLKRSKGMPRESNPIYYNISYSF